VHFSSFHTGVTDYSELSTRDLAPGIYLISLTTGRDRIVRKLIIK
jgi:hypothetical protein